MALIRVNVDMRPHPMEFTFLSFKRSLCVLLAEVNLADIGLPVVFVSELFFVNRSERQQVLYKRPIRVYHN